MKTPTELEMLESQLQRAKDHMQRIELRAEIAQLEKDMAEKRAKLASAGPAAPPAPPVTDTPAAPKPKAIDDEWFSRMAFALRLDRRSRR